MREASEMKSGSHPFTFQIFVQALEVVVVVVVVVAAAVVVAVAVALAVAVAVAASSWQQRSTYHVVVD